MLPRNLVQCLRFWTSVSPFPWISVKHRQKRRPVWSPFLLPIDAGILIYIPLSVGFVCVLLYVCACFACVARTNKNPYHTEGQTNNF